MTRLCSILGAFLSTVATTLAQSPSSTDPRLVVELVAQEPAVKTPTGIAVDERGKIFVIENNTHFRPANYDGHPSDRILIFEELGPDGRVRKRSTFADGFKDSMSIALFRDSVYLATRADIFVLKDTNGDGQAEDKQRIIQLDTKGTYPHNGLSGFAFDTLGTMYFSLGENLGAPYRVIGSDGTALEGGGEGGNIYRCQPDGTKLAQVSTGFWNTYHLAFDAFGRLFAVDNDPDSRPPCRLLHIIPGGDYGYRFRNGRKGLHPFTAWNGELPGTLPMVAGTGEAPSGIVAYESTGLPPEYRGKLLVTSWGDHIVQSFTLKERGASFSATATTLIQGGENFRPVGIAVGPDGAIYLSDWVDKSYPLHGKGRVWRIRMKEPPPDDGLRPSRAAKLETDKLRQLTGHPRIEIRQTVVDELARRKESAWLLEAMTKDKDVRTRTAALSALVRTDDAATALTRAMEDSAPEMRGEALRLRPFTAVPTELLNPLRQDRAAFVRLQFLLHVPSALGDLAEADPFLFSAAVEKAMPLSTLLFYAKELNAPKVGTFQRSTLGMVLALRRSGNPKVRKEALEHILSHPDPAVRRLGIQWVAEEHLLDYAKLLPSAASQSPVTQELFEAYLAAQEMLAGKKRDESSGDEYVLRVLEDPSHPAAFLALALRMLQPDHPKLAADRLSSFLKQGDPGLRREAVRSLAGRSDAASQELLRQLANQGEAAVRADAIAGLAHSANQPDARRLLLALLNEPNLQRDALRSLRAADVEASLLDWSAKTIPEKPDETQREWAAQVALVLRSSTDAGLQEQRKKLEALAGPRPASVEQWRHYLAERGEAEAGERLFYHLKGPQCFTCHRINGRGGNIGPDLSKIAASANRQRIIESILQPGKEIAPQFTTYVVTTKTGQVHTGVIVAEDPRGELVLADAQGKLIRIKQTDIDERTALPISIMPDNVHELMTPAEFRDLIAFLSALK